MFNLKFRVWINKLELMLYNVDLYNNGDVGIDAAEFDKQLRQENKNLCVDLDSSSIIKKHDNNDVYDADYIENHIMNIMIGDEYYWIDENDVIKMIGFVHGDEIIYDRDIIYSDNKGYCIVTWDSFNGCFTFEGTDINRMRNKEIIGNTYTSLY